MARITTSTFALLVLNLWTLCCNAQYRVWRADTRAPIDMEASDRFAPRGASMILQIMPNLSLWNHVHGALTGGSRMDDGYVSTTNSQETAIAFLRTFHNGNGYIYEIAATAQFIDVAATLGRYNPYPEEREFAALGGFQWDQVVRHTRYVNGVPVEPAQENNSYNDDVYNHSQPTMGEPELAGFPETHEAWGLHPWNAFALGGPNCAGGRKVRSLENRAGGSIYHDGRCHPINSAYKAANLWKAKVCDQQKKCG
ncbi:hypothetical protein KVR01_010761 [Diaporthe batatas]|uniref:uncharacterized protein n=1 Tax=Diaporthe batatas TaxID=748121 RepID=UPI001D040CB6|nr:uncharacterized protein KVR01_010761 [Diaporthe batatas]KAG8159100.1 hypothetical protein KVR01_010761 [Diaporthe batatas]